MSCQQGERAVSPPTRPSLTYRTPFRLLAHAGFDPRSAVQFWEDRADVSQASECVASAAFDPERRGEQPRSTFALRIMGSGHPVNQVRVEKLREELDRWRTERERVLAELQARQGNANTTAARHLDMSTFGHVVTEDSGI